MKTEVLKMLREADGYLSGQELSQKLGVSRTAVWKIINQLKEEGYEIQAVRNRGYCLIQAADVITQAELESLIHTRWAGTHLVYYDETDSTNSRARQLGEEGWPHGTLAVADCQLAGRGRRGRNWVSPRGTGIWMSILLRPKVPPQAASMMTLVAALAVAKGIRQAAGLETQIKWPNDIVHNGRKICGILTEMSTEGDWIRYGVIGIGINVNTSQFPPELQDTATSLKLELGKDVKRAGVVAACMEAFEPYYEIYERDKDLSGLIQEYNSLSANIGRQVKVLNPSGSYEGQALGIDSTGSLLVKDQEGQIRTVISGEVSVRGIYGYV